MVKKPGVVWNYYIKKVDGSAVIAFCKFCERSYMQNATRMEKHLARCEKATPEVKHLFLRVSTSKRVNRARLMGAKMPFNWLKQHRELGLDVSTLTEADLDDINEWNRQKDVANEETAVQSIALTEDVSQEDINWDGNEEEIDESPTKKVNDAAKSAKVWVKQLPENYVINQNGKFKENILKYCKKKNTSNIKCHFPFIMLFIFILFFILKTTHQNQTKIVMDLLLMIMMLIIFTYSLSLHCHQVIRINQQHHHHQ